MGFSCGCIKMSFSTLKRPFEMVNRMSGVTHFSFISTSFWAGVDTCLDLLRPRAAMKLDDMG